MEGWTKPKPGAKYAGVGVRTFREWLKQGLEHTRMPSGTILIKFTAIDAFLEQYKVKLQSIDDITEEMLNEFKQ